MRQLATKRNVPTIVLAILSISNFIRHVEAYMIGNNPYHRAETLDREGKYQLEWVIDLEGKRVTFNLTVETKGYVGFGLSSFGKMSGADIVIGGVKPDGSSYFSDYHAVGHHNPELDPSQDWVLHSARESKTHTFLSFSRVFDTCDPQDYPITEDKISLIWAYGERDNIRYHYSNRGDYPIYLINPDYAPKIKITRTDPETDIVTVDGKKQPDIKVWTIKRRLELPTQDTIYWCTMHKAPLLSAKHHTIGFNVRFNSPTGAKHTHHMLTHKCHTGPSGRDARSMFDEWTRHPGQPCLNVRSPRGPMPTEYCTENAQAWAIGSRIFFQPDNIGMPIGDSPDEYYLIQTHYDNQERKAGIIVDYSIEIFYTSELRPLEAGLFSVRHNTPGLPTSLLVPPSSVQHNVHGMCGPACTSRFIPKEGIIIYSLHLHSHNSGGPMKLRHFRGNRELPWIASEDTYHFNFQHFRVLNRHVQVLPGDQLVLSCQYDNTRVNQTVVGGYSTQQAMCTSWLRYHTRLPSHMQCNSEIDAPEFRQHFLGVTNATWQDSRLEYVVEAPPRLRGLTIWEVSDNHVNWDLNRREELQQYQLYHPQVNRCPTELFARSGGGTSNVDVTETVSFPANAIPYQPEPSCSIRRNS